MITKIVYGDVFSEKLQAGESPDTPLHFIVATNDGGKNTHGVAHQIGTRFHKDFLALLGTKKNRQRADIGTVLSREGKMGKHAAHFHAIVTNKLLREGGDQDWSKLLESLQTGFSHLELMNSISGNANHEEVDATMVQELMQVDPKTVDIVELSRRLTAHLDKTRIKFRTVLMGGADGQKHGADLQHTIEAMDKSDILLHLYLRNAEEVASVRNVIPFIPDLKARQLFVEDEKLAVA